MHLLTLTPQHGLDPSRREVDRPCAQQVRSQAVGDVLETALDLLQLLELAADADRHDGSVALVELHAIAEGAPDVGAVDGTPEHDVCGGGLAPAQDVREELVERCSGIRMHEVVDHEGVGDVGDGLDANGAELVGTVDLELAGGEVVGPELVGRLMGEQREPGQSQAERRALPRGKGAQLGVLLGKVVLRAGMGGTLPV